MFSKFPKRTSGGLAVLLLCLVGAAVWTLVGSHGERFSRRGFFSPTGHPQLVAVESLPATTNGEECQWAPASAGPMASLRQQRFARVSATAFAADLKAPGNADRAPIRTLRDTYPTFSAAVVDSIRNEIVVQDENLFNIMVFDRMANTPAKADFTEPKRMIGGPKTTLEFECGTYIDPKTGDIYSVANDVGDRMAVFPHEAKGNVPPSRVLKIRGRNRINGIAVDEEKQELYLSGQSGSVLVYNKFAKDDDQPLRILEGVHTGLGDARGMAIDPKRNLMFVANHGSFHARGNEGGRIGTPSIAVFALDSSGDTPPLRVIQGPQTQLNWPALIYADVDHGELYIANDGADAVLVFKETDEGNVAPTRTIKGSKANLREPSSVYVDTKNQELVVSNMGNHSTNVYARTANGNVAPLRIIRSAPAGKIALTIVNPGAVAYDSKRDELLIPN